MVAVTTTALERLPAHMVAYEQLRGTVAALEAAVSGVRSWVVTMGYRAVGPVAIEITGEPSADHAAVYDFEIQVPIEEGARAHASDRVQIKRFEESDAAVMTLHGPYDVTSIAEPLGRLRAWMQERQIIPGNTVRWVEVTDPSRVTAGEQVTALQYLVSP